MTTKQIFDQEFNSLMADLKTEYNRLGMKASGNWERELEVETTKTTGKIKGLEYSKQLEFGREKTTGTGNGALLGRIKKWIKDKGIVAQAKDNISVSSLAFLITRKIHREGWKRSRHGGVNLVSNIITDKRMQSIINKIGVAQAQEFSLVVEKQFNTLVKA